MPPKNPSEEKKTLIHSQGMVRMAYRRSRQVREYENLSLEVELHLPVGASDEEIKNALASARRIEQVVVPAVDKETLSMVEIEKFATTNEAIAFNLTNHLGVPPSEHGAALSLLKLRAPLTLIEADTVLKALQSLRASRKPEGWKWGPPPKKNGTPQTAPSPAPAPSGPEVDLKPGKEGELY